MNLSLKQRAALETAKMVAVALLFSTVVALAFNYLDFNTIALIACAGFVAYALKMMYDFNLYLLESKERNKKD